MAQRPRAEQYEPPPAAPFANHGKTTASWTLVWLVVVGLTTVAVGMVLQTRWLLVAGVVVAVLGVILGLVLRGMGLGQPTRADAAQQRRRDWYES